MAAYVTLGSTENKTSAGTTAITITAPTSGNFLVLTISGDPGFDGTTTVADNGTAGTTWTVDASARSGTGTSGVGTLLASRPNVTGAVLPTTVTVTWKLASVGVSIAAKSGEVLEFSGMATSSPADHFATTNAGGTSIATGAMTTTTQAAEILVAAYGNETNGDTRSGGADDGLGGTYTYPVNVAGGTNGSNPIGSTGGGSNANMWNSTAYEIVSSTGAYAYNQTLTANFTTTGVVVSYKQAVAVPIPPGLGPVVGVVLPFMNDSSLLR